jgi:hypothetical protein
MKGFIINTEDYGWIVQYNGVAPDSKNDFYQLHPDDVEQILEDSKIFDNLEARIASNPVVEFEIIKHKKMGGVATYAKLKNI